MPRQHLETNTLLQGSAKDAQETLQGCQPGHPADPSEISKRRTGNTSGMPARTPHRSFRDQQKTHRKHFRDASQDAPPILQGCLQRRQQRCHENRTIHGDRMADVRLSP